MGLFARLFGKKPAAPASESAGEEEEIQPTGSQPIQWLPQFVRAVEPQHTPGPHNAEEQSQLKARGVEQLGLASSS